MDCEMCGKEGAENTARIEGVEMTVCDRCAPHGTPVRRAEQRPVFRPKLSRAAEPEEETIEDVRDNIGDILKRYRERQGLSLHDFAARLNMKASVYQHFESGSRKPSIETARQLERTVGEGLVVQMKIKKGSFRAEESAEMTLGDFIKPKRR